MELTIAEALQVENYLAKNKFEFIDLKIEVLDHIISDIESLMGKNLSFENAFKITILKWNKLFEDTSSLFFGLQYSESKIVIKKANKIFKPYFFLYFSVYFLPVIFLKLVPIKFDESFVNFTNGFLSTASFIGILCMLIIFVKTIQSKVKTTYRFILKTQYLGIIFLIITAFFGNVFSVKGEIVPFFAGFTFAGFVIVFINYHFYKKHNEAIQQYKIL